MFTTPARYGLTRNHGRLNGKDAMSGVEGLNEAIDIGFSVVEVKASTGSGDQTEAAH